MSNEQKLEVFFLKSAMLASELSNCNHTQSGCVIVKDKRIIVTGYNASYPESDLCSNVGCKIVEDRCTRTIPAEMDALLKAAKVGNSAQGATAYLTDIPDFIGAQSLVAAGIDKVITLTPIKDTKILEIFEKTGTSFELREAPFNKILFHSENYNTAVSFEPV